MDSGDVLAVVWQCSGVAALGARVLARGLGQCELHVGSAMEAEAVRDSLHERVWMRFPWCGVAVVARTADGAASLASAVHQQAATWGQEWAGCGCVSLGSSAPCDGLRGRWADGVPLYIDSGASAEA